MATFNLKSTGAASLLVSAGDGACLIANLDASNTLWLGDDSATAASNLPYVTPLPPGGSLVVNGENDVYGIADPSTGNGTIQTVVLPGGLAYFLGLTQGFGKLVISSIQSPNFQSGLTGWIIRKDGSAEFHSISIPAGSGGAIVTFAAVAPSSPNIGDVWYDTSNGMLAHQWNGTTWAPFQIGTGGIANNAITLALLDNSVSARAIGGVTTTISATAPLTPLAGDIWINSSNGFQLERYSGSAFVPIAWNAHDVITAGTITATEIQANTITATQIAAGIILAGVVNGTVISGATFLGTNWEENSTGSFGYSGTPALGNLIFSDCALATATATTTDAHGNTAYAGRCAYAPNGTATPTTIIQMYNGQLNISSPTGITHGSNTSPANWSGGAPGIGELFSGVNGASDTAAAMFIQSAQQGASGSPEINLQGTAIVLPSIADPPTTGSPWIIGNTQGTPKAKTAKGLAGTMALTQTDSTLRSNATTTPTQISGAFNIPANDAVANTCYRLRLYGTGTTGTTPPLFSITLDGMGATGQASTGWAAAALPASTTFEYWVEAIIMVNTTGAAGSARMFLSGGVSANGRPTTGQSINFGAANTSVTVDTTTLSQMLIKIAPGSTTGAPSINGHTSTFERLGP